MQNNKGYNVKFSEMSKEEQDDLIDYIFNNLDIVITDLMYRQRKEKK